MVDLSHSDHRGISRRWNEMVKTRGWFANILKKDLDRLFRLVRSLMIRVQRQKEH